MTANEMIVFYILAYIFGPALPSFSFDGTQIQNTKATVIIRSTASEIISNTDISRQKQKNHSMLRNTANNRNVIDLSL